MFVICAWCKKFLREKEPLDDKRISHGICESCKSKVEEEIELLKLSKLKKEPCPGK